MAIDFVTSLHPMYYNNTPLIVVVSRHELATTWTCCRLQSKCYGKSTANFVSDQGRSVRRCCPLSILFSKLLTSNFCPHHTVCRNSRSSCRKRNVSCCFCQVMPLCYGITENRANDCCGQDRTASNCAKVVQIGSDASTL